jgi:WD40 repeat protein/predicted Ser/Thr protein kinase
VPDAEGIEIGGYALGDVLGRGGMATVYRAIQSEPRRDVALKILHTGVAGEVGIARFKQEAEVLGRLRHEGIAQVYDFGMAHTPEGEHWYIAMELVDGRPLLAYASEEDLGLRARVELLLQVLDAVADAHRQGVIHRDLKPANILVNRRGRIKLLDFGVARVLDEGEAMTRTGEFVGTLLYMSPEQVSRGLVDTRADLHAIGLLARELLTGIPCRDRGLGVAGLLASIRDDDLPPLASVAPDVPADLGCILDRAVDRVPQRRYPTADAFADDLRRYLRGEVVLARPPTWSYRVQRFVARNRTLVVATAAVVVALGAGLSLALRAGQIADSARRDAAALAASRLRMASMLRVQAALGDVWADRPQAAERRLARVPPGERTWIWAFAHAALDQSMDHVALESLTSEDVASGQVEAAVVSVQRGGGLVATGRTRRIPVTPQEAACGVARGFPRPVVLSMEGHEVGVLHGSSLASGGTGPGAHMVLPARDRTPSFEVWTGRSSLGLREAATGVRHENVLVNRRPSCVALHPTRSLLVVGTENRTLLLYDLAGKRELGTPLPQGGAVQAVAWSEDGRRFASVDRQGTLRVYAAADRKLLYKARSRAVDCVAARFAPGGDVVLGLTRHGLFSWHVRSESLNVLRHHAHSRPNYVYGVAISPDGRWIASAAWDGTVRISSVPTGQLLATLRTDGDMASDVQFVGDARVAVGENSRVELFDVSTGRVLAAWPAPQRHRRLAASPGGDRMAWRRRWTLGATQVATRPDALPADLVPHAPQERAEDRERRPWHYESFLTYTPDGSRLLESTAQNAWVAMDAATGEVRLRGAPGETPGVMPDADVHPDGKRLVVAGPGRDVSIYDLATGALRRTLRGHDDQVFTVAVHPAGRIIASGAGDDTIRLWDLEAGGESVVLTGHDFYVHDLEFLPDGSALVSASGDGTVRIWSTIPLRDRRRAARAERERQARLTPRVRRILEASGGDGRAALEAVSAPSFAEDPADRATARDLVLLLRASGKR